MVDTSYKRQDNIDDIIQSAKLPYNAWKVLFLIDGEMTVSQISELLDEDSEEIKKSLERLEKEKLIEGISDDEPVEPVAEEIVEPEYPLNIPTLPDIETELPAQEEPEIEETIPPLIDQEAEEDHFRDIPEIIPADDFSQPEYESALWEENDVDTKDSKEEPAENDQDFGEADAFIKEEIHEPEEDIEINIPAEDEIAEEENVSLDLNFDEPVEALKDEVEAPAMDQIQQDFDTALPPSAGTVTVLVIDDSIVIRKMVEIALEDEDFNIETAISGKDGLSKIDQLNPDIIILDLMLPDINGIEILKTVKSTKKMPVIMLSGKDSPQMVESAKSEGADAFLPKPFKDEELVDKIKSLLNL